MNKGNYTVGVASTVKELTGVGTEYLMVDGEVIARFIDGCMDTHKNFQDAIDKNDPRWNEPTVKVAI